MSEPNADLAERKFQADEAQRQRENARDDVKLRFRYLLKSAAAVSLVPVVAAALALVGSVAAGELSARATLRAQTMKNETDLIVQAISSKDQGAAIKALKFLADAGMIDDYRDKVVALATEQNGQAVPLLAPARVADIQAQMNADAMASQKWRAEEAVAIAGAESRVENDQRKMGGSKFQPPPLGAAEGGQDQSSAPPSAEAGAAKRSE